MRENRLSGSEGGGAKSIATPYPYIPAQGCRNPGTPVLTSSRTLKEFSTAPAPTLANAFSITIR
jgi:hypothetical protein